MIHIGLDPGQSTGVAIWDSSKKEFLTIRTCDFWDAISVLMDAKDRHIDLMVTLENPDANKPVFRGKFAAHVDNNRKMDKIAQNIGSNKRDGQLLAEFCANAEIPVVLVTPTKGKYTRETFEKLTKYTKPTSQHGRDAAMLVWGK